MEASCHFDRKRYLRVRARQAPPGSARFPSGKI
jgi:hypothetical protein